MRSEKISAYQPRDRSKGRPRQAIRRGYGHRLARRVEFARGRKPAPRRWGDLHSQRAQPRTVSWSAIILSGNLCGEPYLITLRPVPIPAWPTGIRVSSSR